MNCLENLAAVLEKGNNEVHVDPEIGKMAHTCIDRMLAFSVERKAKAAQASQELGLA